MVTFITESGSCYKYEPIGSTDAKVTNTGTRVVKTGRVLGSPQVGEQFRLLHAGGLLITTPVTEVFEDGR